MQAERLRGAGLPAHRKYLPGGDLRAQSRLMCCPLPRIALLAYAPLNRDPQKCNPRENPSRNILDNAARYEAFATRVDFRLERCRSGAVSSLNGSQPRRP